MEIQKMLENTGNRLRSATTWMCVLACAAPMSARVIRINIEKRESPAYNGRSFGKAGQYQLISGHFTGELNPADQRNEIVTDILFAPRNARGMVEYSATFAIA